MTDLQKMADKLAQARRLIADARVIGALSNEVGVYHTSLLVGALETHASVLQVHVSSKALAEAPVAEEANERRQSRREYFFNPDGDGEP